MTDKGQPMFMMKKLLESTILGLLERWFLPEERAEERGPFQINEQEVKKFLTRTGSLLALLFLNFQLFVGSILMMAVAAAHSIEVYGTFTATPVFWTGLWLASTALVITGLSGWALLSTKFSWKSFFVLEAAPDRFSVKDRFVFPFFEGLAEGLRGYSSRARERDASRPDRAA